MRRQRKVTRSWFNKVRREFEYAAKPFAGQPICYVEVGLWRGDSAEWVCKNILTHEDAVGYGIDPYKAGHNYDQTLADEAYLQTVERLRPYNFTVVRQNSQDHLRVVTGTGAIDLLYLDGAHDAHSVMLDFAYAWPSLKQGSVIIFDDWGIGRRKGEFHVPAACSAIMQSFGRWLELVAEPKLQFAVRVKEYPQLGAICK